MQEKKGVLFRLNHTVFTCFLTLLFDCWWVIWCPDGKDCSLNTLQKEDCLDQSILLFLYGDFKLHTLLFLTSTKKSSHLCNSGLTESLTLYKITFQVILKFLHKWKFPYRDMGHYPLGQKFQIFRSRIKWNSLFQNIHFKNFGQPLEVDHFSQNTKITGNFLFHLTVGNLGNPNQNFCPHGLHPYSLHKIIQCWIWITAFIRLCH